MVKVEANKQRKNGWQRDPTPGRTWILCVCYLQNHVFLDPEIGRSVAACDVWTGDAQLPASSSFTSTNSFFI